MFDIVEVTAASELSCWTSLAFILVPRYWIADSFVLQHQHVRFAIEKIFLVRLDVNIGITTPDIAERLAVIRPQFGETVLR